LIQIGQPFGKQVDRGIRLGYPLTQQNMADMVAASRQHVNYVLADFRSRRLISGSGRHLTLTDLAGLERIAAAPSGSPIGRPGWRGVASARHRAPR
jgi:hypothetical protein